MASYKALEGLIGNDRLLLLEVLDSGVIEFDALKNAEVWHDPWCALMVGEGHCDCSPEIFVTAQAGRFLVREDRTVVALDVN